MKQPIKKNRLIMMLTTALTLLPLLVGLLLWGKLPQKLAIHFDSSGVPNGWGSRAFVVFALPCIMLAMHASVVLLPMREAEQKGIPPRMQAFAPFIAPAFSLFINGLIYAYALGLSPEINLWVMAFIGAILLVLGNYMPKSRPNRYFGMRSASIRRDPEIWRKVNRFAGWGMSICGALAILAALLPLPVDVPYMIISACSLLLVGSYGYAAYLARKK